MRFFRRLCVSTLKFLFVETTYTLLSDFQNGKFMDRSVRETREFMLRQDLHFARDFETYLAIARDAYPGSPAGMLALKQARDLAQNIDDCKEGWTTSLYICGWSTANALWSKRAREVATATEKQKYNLA